MPTALPLPPGYAWGAAPAGPFPVSIADLVYAHVAGNPTPMQLHSAETHFRDINRMDEGADALRRLRLATQAHGVYPTLSFVANSVAVPLITAPPSTSALPAQAEEALRAAVADVARMQLRLASVQYSALLSDTIAHALQHAEHPALARVTGATPHSLPGAVSMQAPSFDAVPRQAAASGTVPTHRAGLGAAPTHSAGLNAAPMPAATPGSSLQSAVPPQMPLSYIAAQQSAARPLGGLVEQWIGRHDGELAARWNRIESTRLAAHGASSTLAFKQFLLGLMYSHIHQLASTRDEVSQWLVQAADPGRAAMRAEAFAICEDGSAMCRDNALLIWNRLKMLRLTYDAQAGAYAGKLGDLCQLALTMLRWDTLNAVAQAKVMALHNENRSRLTQGRPLVDVDPVEITLHYQIALHEELRLPLSVKDMFFVSLSALEEADIAQARRVIAAVEADGFYSYLMHDFTPFLAEVRRQIGPHKCDEVRAALDARLDDFEERVQQRLRAEGFPAGDDAAGEDARRAMGVVIDREIRYEAWLPHANAVLAAAGLALMPPARTPPGSLALPLP